MATRVLIIEDDADINQIVATRLERDGYLCTQAFSGSEAKLLLERGLEAHTANTHAHTPRPDSHAADKTEDFPFDLIISDLMLPGTTGEELVAAIREHGADVPVIVISARTTAADKIDLLKLGADDYLTKPFDLDELAARVEVQLRHCGHVAVSGSAGSTLRFRDWELDHEARTFIAAGKPVTSPASRFNIVEILAYATRAVSSPSRSSSSAWGEPYGADANTVERAQSRTSGRLKPVRHRRLHQDRLGHGLQARRLRDRRHSIRSFGTCFKMTQMSRLKHVPK